MDSPTPLRLEATLDLKAATPLLGEIRARRGRDLVLEATDVRRLGGQCLQVLLAARAAWAADGHAFEIRDASPAFAEAAALLGAANILGAAEQESRP